MSGSLHGERRGSVVERSTRDRGVACSSLTGFTARHIYPCLVLDQPRKTHLDKIVDRDVKNQIKQKDDCASFVVVPVISRE